MDNHLQSAARSILSKGLVRVQTGAIGLDSILQGGLPTGAWVLVIGPPGSGKSTLGKQFLYTASQSHRPAIILSTADSNDMIFQSMDSFGWVQDEAQIKVIDCYSWRTGNRSAIDLRTLTDVSIRVTDFFDDGEKRMNNACFVIDSFTDFLLHNPPDGALRFLGQLKTKLHPRNVTTLVLLEEGPHTPDVVSTAEYIADGTIRAKFDETGRFLMVTRMVATPVELGWSKFTIRKGIDFVVRDFFGGAGV